MLQFSTDQAIKFMGIPEAQRLFQATIQNTMPNGVSLESLKTHLSEYTKFQHTITINDDEHVSDEEFQSFCERFIITVRTLKI